MSAFAALLRDAIGLQQAGRLDEARALCGRILAANPEHPDALHVAGIVEFRRGRFDEAAALIGRAIARSPGTPAYHGNLGNVYKDAGRIDDAIASYRTALSLDSSHVAARNNLGVLLLERGEIEEAITTFRAAIAAQPGHFRAHLNLGSAQYRSGDVDAALTAWRHALALQPDLVEALAQIGWALVTLGRFDEALPFLRRRATLEPASAVAHADLALALHRHGDLERAAVSYERAVELAPEAIEVVCNLCALLQKICDWERLERYWPRVMRAIADGRAGVPLGLLVSHPDITPQMQLAAARANAASFGGRPALAPRRDRESRGKLRIGYLSADFREHASAWLAAPLFEMHDRDRFEIVLLSYGPDDRGPSRERVRRAADRFIDLASLDDETAARRIVDERIDILVDMNGNTDNGRMGIAAFRPARVQVNWLGFPGTLGAACYDYLIADRIVIPDGSERHYSEAVVRLPDCYQSNDAASKRPMAAPDRGAHGLPASAVVLCCFNQSFKITAPIFALWLRVLAAVPDTVLWLLEDNRVARSALQRRAAAQGVAAERLVFAPPRPHDEHLARYRAADLAVDTFPCVSHTTASDALRMGCPLVTCAGDTFASRVAASVLANAGQAECVTTSLDAYEARMIELVRDPDRTAALGRRLDDSRERAPLFDATRFARNIETAYLRMAELDGRGGGARGFDVVPDARPT